jgi:SecD/SecF fusion protein
MDSFLAIDSLTSSLTLLGQAATQAGKAAAEAGQKPSSMDMWTAWGWNIFFVLVVFVLPFLVAKAFSRMIRFPGIATRLGWMLVFVFGSFMFAWNSNFMMKMGPDIKGGTNLIYEIMAPADGSEKVNAGALASALGARLNPSGTAEISIRPYGESQIEIIVPNEDELELGELKRRISSAGALQFRIVANTRDHGDVIEIARQQAQSPDRIVRTRMNVLNAEGREVGRWVQVRREEIMKSGVFPLMTPVLGDIIRNSETGQILTNLPLDTSKDYALENYLKRENIPEVDVLMAFERGGEPYVRVSGDDLAVATVEIDSKTGQPAVGFKLTTEGSSKMMNMTLANIPEGAFHRRMAIIMDDQVLSAPQLNEAISTSGQITGQFTMKEVEFLVSILRAGRLPATLSSEPSSENRVGAGLGSTTIKQGGYASVGSILITFVCILVYYRFAGVIAVIALLINGLMIYGTMIFIGQPLTLPGLAGFVLTVGMSVDANVLIYERIREERQRGAAVRLAVRNGFDRALTTIIDSNLTTLIAAIVLYWIGTDQVRGFAVALIIGLATSMFTAIFCSRILFDISEKLGIVNLSMWDGIAFIKKNFLGQGDIDFMGKQFMAVSASLALAVVGLVAAGIRGKDMLNIDFTGGTSVTFQLTQPLDTDKVREITRKILDKDENGESIESTLVRVEKDPIDTVYTLVTSVKQRLALQERLVTGFQKEGVGLITYSLKVNNDKPTSSTRRASSLRYVSTQDPAATTPAPAPEAAANPLRPQESTTPTSAESTPPPTAGTSSTAQAEVTSIPEANKPANSAAEAPAGQANSPAAGGSSATTFTPAAKTSVTLSFFKSGAGDAADTAAKLDGPSLIERLKEAAKKVGTNLESSQVALEPAPIPKNWKPGDISGHAVWNVTLPFDAAQSKQITDALGDLVSKQPLWLSLSNIGERVAGEMQQRAIGALLLSLVFITAYIWFRFQKVAYGLAAVIALVHDVAITFGIMAMCHWLARPFGFLLIEDFKIGLTEVAAFLTIVGYSLNDTIVVFDRIREVRGKSPVLTSKMVNDSVNQTLSRTLLTSGTTILTLIIFYIFGGEGIHAFSFALLFGIVVGTYSSIFVASPVLLWLVTRENAKNQVRRVTA